MKCSLKFSQYKGVGSIIKHYWEIYGGFRSFIKSPYLHISFLFACVAPLWTTSDWYEIPLQVIPSLLGFSLAGYAMFLAFGDDTFRELISGEYKDGNPSPFLDFNATFMHFILMQVISIFLAIFAAAWDIVGNLLAWLAFASFIYALLTAFAVAVEIFRCARIYDTYVARNAPSSPSTDHE